MSTHKARFSPEDLARVIALANEFDKHRHCGWNASHVPSDYESDRICAKDVPEFASLGDQCHATLQELALLHTLRPCKECGSEFIYFGYYKVACCSCLGNNEECDDCKDGGCQNCAENMNLRDAITRWNLNYGDSGARGRVQAIG